MRNRNGFRVRARFGLAALLMFLSAGAALALDDGGPAVHGDESYVQGDLPAALAAYREALEAHPSDYHVLCRLARVESVLGEDARGEDRRRMIATAVEHARGAVAAAPDSAQGHVWLAVALGRQALNERAKAKLSLSREIKSEVDRALQIDPGIGRAYHVRAVWNREVASLNFFERAAANTVLGGVPKGASMENALRDFEKAVELEPQYVNHHLELGRTLMKMKRRAEARRELERAVELPPTSHPRDPRYQAEARELLAELPRGE